MNLIINTSVVILFIVFAIFIYFSSRVKIVHEQSRYIIEFFGVPTKKPWHPGLHFLMPFCAVREKVDLRQQQIQQVSQVKTADNVFVEISYVVRYAVSADDKSAMDFVYKVADPVGQLCFRVENEIRQIITGMNFNDLYSQKDSISAKVVSDQNIKALDTGIKIIEVVIEQPVPPSDIQEAMNNVIASENKRKAAEYEAEAERIKRVGIAKAESESKRLQGEGIAAQRQAIANGIEEAMLKLKNGGMSTDQSLAILMKTIDADMITTASLDKSNSMIFIPNSLGSVNSDDIYKALPLVASERMKKE